MKSAACDKMKETRNTSSIFNSEAQFKQDIARNILEINSVYIMRVRTNTLAKLRNIHLQLKQRVRID